MNENHNRKVTELYNGTTSLMKKTFVGNYYEIEEDEEENIRRLYVSIRPPTYCLTDSGGLTLAHKKPC